MKMLHVYVSPCEAGLSATQETAGTVLNRLYNALCWLYIYIFHNQHKTFNNIYLIRLFLGDDALHKLLKQTKILHQENAFKHPLPVAKATVHSLAVVLLWLIHCFMYLPLFLGFCVWSLFWYAYFVSFLVLQ